MSKSTLDTFTEIRGIIMDVDGVLTNNQILLTEDGQFLRSMNLRDGYALKRALTKGFKLAVITGGRSEGVVKRLNLLGIHEIHTGIEDKKPVMDRVLESWKLSASETAYLGDDLPDLDCMKSVGLACSPADAMPEILAVSHFISTIKGGQGFVREVVEKMMKAQNCW